MAEAVIERAVREARRESPMPERRSGNVQAGHVRRTEGGKMRSSTHAMHPASPTASAVDAAEAAAAVATEAAPAATAVSTAAATAAAATTTTGEGR
jgi:hypothetical protein